MRSTSQEGKPIPPAAPSPTAGVGWAPPGEQVTDPTTMQMRRHRVAVLLTLILLVLPVCCFVCAVPAYAATAIALVQKGPEVSGSGSSVTPTLSAASTAGPLLVATTVDLNSGCTTDNFTVPAGWVQAASV